LTRRTINTEKFSAALRERGIRAEKRQVLITRLDGSDQESDLSRPPNCNGLGRVHRFHRGRGLGWPENPLPIDPAVHWLGESFVDSIDAEVFQNAICNWRCWYCYVDFQLLSADPDHSSWVTPRELLDLYESIDDRPRIIDLSGGQPDLVPEWVLWMTDEVAARGLAQSTYVWSDDNLSNDYLWRYLDESSIGRLASRPNYGRVGCFKGFDRSSFAFNTGAAPELFDRQFEIMKRIVDFGFDVYGYATLTSTQETSVRQGVADFLDRLQEEIHPNFPLRTIPLKIFEFTPTRGRPENDPAVYHCQEMAVAAWEDEMRKRFSSKVRQERIFEHSLA
jgi:uncharacterized Fe-S cluster-containing radical SAM superfamily protein